MLGGDEPIPRTHAVTPASASRASDCSKFAAVGGLLGLLMVAGPVASGSTAGVQIGEANNRYQFSPATAYVNVGGTVT